MSAELVIDPGTDRRPKRPLLLRLPAVGDGLHLAAAHADDGQEFARAAFVQPLLGVDARNVRLAIGSGTV